MRQVNRLAGEEEGSKKENVMQKSPFRQGGVGLVEAREIRKKVLHNLQGRTQATDADVYREIDRVILEQSHGVYSSIQDREKLREQIFNSIRRLDVLEPYLQDETVTEIMVIGKDKIFVERNGELCRTEDSFYSDEELYRLIDQIVSPTNRTVNESSPIVDCRLKDGSRVHIVIPPISLEGPSITIRKFQKGGMTIERLLNYEEFPTLLEPVLGCLVRGRYNILISGATNSGKSSLINSLAEYISPAERIITIEDSAELQFYQVDNLVRLETRNANVEGKNQITMDDLIKASLRMRPTRIIVGEVRGAEATSMMQALSTGHSGSFSSIHANSCRDALRRLETMVLMGVDMPLRAISGQIASAIDILIHLGRLEDGKRRLLEICEVLGFEDDQYQINTLFRFQMESRLKGGLHCVHPIHDLDKMKSYGEYDNYIEAMKGWDIDISKIENPAS